MSNNNSNNNNVFRKGDKVSTNTCINKWDGDRIETNFIRFGTVQSDQLGDLVGHVFYYVKFEPELVYDESRLKNEPEDVFDRNPVPQVRPFKTGDIVSIDNKRRGIVVSAEENLGSYRVQFDNELVYIQQLQLVGTNEKRDQIIRDNHAKFAAAQKELNDEINRRLQELENE